MKMYETAISGLRDLCRRIRRRQSGWFDLASAGEHGRHRPTMEPLEPRVMLSADPLFNASPVLHPAGWDNSFVYPAPHVEQTGLNQPSEEHQQWMHDNLIVTQQVQLNELGLQRVNNARIADGLEPLTENDLTVSEWGGGMIGMTQTELDHLEAAGGQVADTQLTAPLNFNLPDAVDNSQTDWFPEIGDQIGGSCGSFSSTYYMATYMTAMARGLTVTDTYGDNIPEYVFSTKWTYNMLNGMDEGGSGPTEAYRLFIDHGVVSLADLPYDSNLNEWVYDDPDMWRNALRNRMDQAGFLGGVHTDTGLDTLKLGLTNGFIFNYGDYISSYIDVNVSDDPATAEDDAYAGQQVYYAVNGTDGSHAITIVGYNDNIWTDINQNSTVDSGEKGALLVANSWDVYNHNDGFFWLAYDALREQTAVDGWTPEANRRAAVTEGEVYWVTARESYIPQLVAEFTVNHPQRQDLDLQLAIDDTAGNTIDTWLPSWNEDFWGGPRGFDGLDYSGDPASAPDGTFVLDFTDLDVQPGTTLRYKMGVNDSSSSWGDAVLKSFKLTDAHGKVLDQAPSSGDGSVPVTDTGGANTYEFAWIETALNELVTQAAIKQTPVAPVIDQTVDAAWDEANLLTVANINSGTVSGDSDLSATWQALWDSDYLYFLVDVTDDIAQTDSGSAWWDDDCIELFIDVDNSKLSSYDGVNDFQLGFRRNDATSYVGTYSAPVSGVVHSFTDTGGANYRLEVAVPWQSLGLIPAANAMLGLDVQVGDDDDGGGRDGKRAWYGTNDNAWLDPSLFGTIRLTEQQPDLIPLQVTVIDDELDGDFSPADLSLREAIYLADLYAGDDNITFNASLAGQNIQLDPWLGGIILNSNVSITGSTTDLITIDALGMGDHVINVMPGVNATLTGLKITGGYATGFGGGICNQGSLTVDTCDITGNACNTNSIEGYGGGIYSTGELTVLNSTITDNLARSNAAVYIATGNTNPTTLINSTISGNIATFGRGGITTYSSPMLLRNCTIVNNGNLSSSNQVGGGCYIGSSPDVQIYNTIIAGNWYTQDGQQIMDDVYGTFNSNSSYNLIGVIDGSTGLDHAATQYGTGDSPLDAMISPLGDYGGPVPTHALRSTSTAIDSGSNSLALDEQGGPLITDQRGGGFNRIVDSTVDIGAVEMDIAALPDPPTSLAATAYEDHVDLTWQDPAPVADYYYLYRSEQAGDPSPVLIAADINSLNYTDNNVCVGVWYYYSVTAVDSTVGESDYSVEVAAKPRDAVAPAAPTGLVAVAGDGGVGLDWNDNTDSDLAYYNVYRSLTPGDPDPQLIDGVLADSRYVDRTATNGVTWYYTVTAVDTSDNESNPSTQVSATPATINLTVDTAIDEYDYDYSTGDFSLREAIYIASISANNTVLFDPAISGNPIVLDQTLGQLEINDVVNIQGLTAGNITIDGNALVRVVFVRPGADVSISHVTITNGSVTDAGGGGIYNAGSLTLDNVLVSNNDAYDSNGGGIYNSGSLDILYSSITGNYAGDPSDYHSGYTGGGIHNAGSLTVSYTNINSNTADPDYHIYQYYGGGGGGGIYHTGDGDLIISHSLISDNNTAYGGGVSVNYAANGTITLQNTTISGNTAVFSGGGVRCTAPATLVNCTVTKNEISVQPPYGPTSGAGLNADDDVILYNTIIADNLMNVSSPYLQDIYGTVHASSENNLIGTDSYSGGLTNGANGNIVGVTDLSWLESLADNGGTTMTHAITLTSPAADAGSDAHASAAGITTDQRGGLHDRMVRSVDIGAFENQLPLSPINLAALPGDARVDLSWSLGTEPNVLYYKLYRSNTPGGPHALVAVSFGGDNITDFSVYNDTTYYYQLSAVNNLGDESDVATEVSATPTATAPELPPSRPTFELTAADHDNSAIQPDRQRLIARMTKPSILKKWLAAQKRLDLTTKHDPNLKL